MPTFFNDHAYYMYITPSWTLVYEMFFYAIFTMAIFFAGNKNRIVIITACSIVIMVFVVNFFSLQGERLRWVNFSFMIGDTLMLNFVAGCVFALLYRRSLSLNISNVFLMLSSILLFLLGMMLGRDGVPRFLSFGLPSIFIVSFISLYRCNRNRVNDFLILLGNASYSIYLIHYLFAAVLFRITGGEGEASILVSTIFMLSSIVTGTLFHLYIERKITKLPIFSIK